ncbi:MAG: cytochrome c family protein [Ignavibacteriaceae bacterium]|nr:cytochrome c family protein [Ignavibacteriaceae bacterium]
MFRKIIFLALFILPSMLFAQNKFVGVDACGMCHKSEKQGKQLDIWKSSQHSKAYETLKSEKADAIAKEKGFDKPAVEVEDCLTCHAVGYNVSADLKEKKFNVEDGVQCESCHGAGSEYKSMKVMKSKEESIKKGLLVYDDAATLCVTCHNDKSPTFKGFDFEKYWALIKHDVPE